MVGRHGFSYDFKGLTKSPLISYVFLPRATMDAIFVPWLWADVNMAGERHLFPLKNALLTADICDLG